MKTRRELLIALGAGVIAAPAATRAQGQSKVWRIGVLNSIRRPESLETHFIWGRFLRRTRELGYVEGKNVSFEWRFAAGDYGKMVELAADLVSTEVDAIVTTGTEGIRAAQRATRTIPIVFGGGSDVVAQGLVKSLARPGGNTTGVTLLLSDTTEKQLEILIRLAPKVSRVALLRNPASLVAASQVSDYQAAGEKLKVKVVPFEATPQGLASVFARAVEERVDALIWIVDNTLIDRRREIAELSTKHRLPSLSALPEYPESGGLAGYGFNRGELAARLADYVDKIFKGAKPGDLPVEQPTKLDLVINRKTARALGLTIPADLLVLADKVID